MLLRRAARRLHQLFGQDVAAAGHEQQPRRQVVPQRSERAGVQRLQLLRQGLHNPIEQAQREQIPEERRVALRTAGDKNLPRAEEPSRRRHQTSQAQEGGREVQGRHGLGAVRGAVQVLGVHARAEHSAPVRQGAEHVKSGGEAFALCAEEPLAFQEQSAPNRGRQRRLDFPLQAVRQLEVLQPLRFEAGVQVLAG